MAPLPDRARQVTPPPVPGACPSRRANHPEAVSLETASSTSWSLTGTKPLGHAGEMTLEPATYPGYRFPAEIISYAVWLYHVESMQSSGGRLPAASRGRLLRPPHRPQRRSPRAPRTGHVPGLGTSPHDFACSRDDQAVPLLAGRKVAITIIPRPARRPRAPRPR